jgi:hypothetical protein
MDKKKCSKCKEVKNISEFSRDIGNNDGYRSSCKTCKKKSDFEYRVNNKEKLKTKYKERSKPIIEKNRLKKEKSVDDLINEFVNLEFGPWKITKYVGYYLEKNGKYPRHHFEKECKCCGVKLIMCISQIKNQIKKKITCNFCNETINIHTNEKKCSSCNEWKKAVRGVFPLCKNRPLGVYYYCSECSNKKRRALRESKEQRQKEYQQKLNRLKTDKLYKFRTNVSCNIKNALKSIGHKKPKKSTEILECSILEFKVWIESQFTDGMSWDNRNLWDLDHKIPISLAKTCEEAVELCHYSNYQPLWTKVNISKSNRIEMKYLTEENKIRFSKFIDRYFDFQN